MCEDNERRKRCWHSKRAEKLNMHTYTEFIIKHRRIVVLVALAITLLLVAPIAGLRVIIDPNKTLPQDHPYVTTSTKVEQLFGSRYVTVIGIRPKTGNIYQPQILAKVAAITKTLNETPGVIKSNLLSLSSSNAKAIRGSSEGLDVERFIPGPDMNSEQLQRLREKVKNNTAYHNTIVSTDEQTAGILVEFNHTNWRDIVHDVELAVAPQRDDSVDIWVGGLSVYMAALEEFSQRMLWLFPIALIVTGLVHFEAFRTVQGLVLPLVTALLAVVWGTGVMAALGIALDAFNTSTPILILAVGAGHAVQILKRYYEEFMKLMDSTNISPVEANKLAIVKSLIAVGPAMLTAGGIAILGFLSLLVFEITAIKTFGVFTAIGIMSAMIIEFTLIPAVRAMLPPPSLLERQREAKRTWLDFAMDKCLPAAIGVSRRGLAICLSLVALAASIGLSKVYVDNSNNRFFSSSLPFQKEDQKLNAHLGGTNTLYVLLQTGQEDGIKDPQVLQYLDDLAAFIALEPEVGKSISLADFIKQINMAMNNNSATSFKIPSSRDLIAQYLLLYSLSGDPTDFDRYVDTSYSNAVIRVFLKTDSTAYFGHLLQKINQYIVAHPMSGVRLSLGGSVAQAAALNEVIVKDKLLNVAQIGCVIFIVSSLVFRSVTVGSIVLVPLIVTVLINFTIMGILGIPLNTATAVISAMAVGIGADYAIYLIFRIREELEMTGDIDLAISKAMRSAGKAVFFVASAIAAGYSVFLLSWGFNIHLWFGLLVASSMVTSAAASLLIIPNVIRLFEPSGVVPSRMRPATSAAGIAVLLLTLLTVSTVMAEETPRNIMEKNFHVSKVARMTSASTMTLIAQNGQERIRKMTAVSLLDGNGIDSKVLIRFISPKDISGSGFLQLQHHDSEDDMWVYLPAIKKVRRLTAGNKNDSFFGTDFSNGDILLPPADSYTRSLLRTDFIGGHDTYVIESVPSSLKIKEDYGYSKTIAWIRTDNFMETKIEYYDQSGELLKTQVIEDLIDVEGQPDKVWAKRREMVNHQTRHKTVLSFDLLDSLTSVSSDLYSVRYLERER